MTRFGTDSRWLRAWAGRAELAQRPEGKVVLLRTLVLEAEASRLVWEELVQGAGALAQWEWRPAVETPHDRPGGPREREERQMTAKMMYTPVYDYRLDADLQPGARFLVGYALARTREEAIRLVAEEVEGRWRNWSGSGAPARRFETDSKVAREYAGDVILA